MEDNIPTRDIKIEDFMDVVMAYKCKFCSITCSTTQQMGAHIKQEHVFTEREVTQGQSQVTPETETESMSSQETDTINAMESNNASIFNDQVTNSFPPSSESASVPVQNTQELPEITNISQTHVSQNSAVFVTGGENYTLTSSSNMAPNTQLTTKLLYVCGQCSVGFNSIEDCKEHMIDSHGQTDMNMEIEELEATSSHVSVGTQMEPKKKPGRKKKSEIKKEVVTSEESDEEDRDWVPENPSGRARRKIRPPRALKEDYYINNTKKKKSKKRQIMNNKELKHKCYLYGCLARFSTKENLDIHVGSHNTSNEGFTCTQCKQNFEAWRLLRIHLHRKHEIDLDLATCEICGFKVDTMNKLRVHKEIHSDSRPYTCDICGKGFRQYSQMKNHQQVHMEYQKKEDQFVPCPTCQRTFVNKKCLMKHQQQVHSEVKNFKCTMCTYATTRKAMLTLHLRVHTGEKPYKCDLCAYATGDHNSLRRHKMRHTGQKQYKCNYCPYSCIQAVSLKSHLRKKHPGCEGNFICEDCSFQSVSKHAYELHLQDHKNGRISNRHKPLRSKTSMVTQTDTDEVGDFLTMADGNESTQVKMLVQTMKSGEAQVSAEDLAKLSCYEGLMTGEMSAAQLIYSALSAIGQSEKSGVPQTAELLGGVQCTTLSAESEEGVTSHTITFHLPANFQSAAQPQENETVLFGQPVEIIETVDESAVRFIESNIPEDAATDADGNIVLRGIVVGQDEQGDTQIGTEANFPNSHQSFIVINQEASYQQSTGFSQESEGVPQDVYQTTRGVYQQAEIAPQEEADTQGYHESTEINTGEGFQDSNVSHQRYQQDGVSGGDFEQQNVTMQSITITENGGEQTEVNSQDGFQIRPVDQDVPHTTVYHPRVNVKETDQVTSGADNSEQVMDQTESMIEIDTTETTECQNNEKEVIPDQIITINLQQISQ